jgi:hypothetical protein
MVSVSGAKCYISGDNLSGRCYELFTVLVVNTFGLHWREVSMLTIHNIKYYCLALSLFTIAILVSLSAIVTASLLWLLLPDIYANDSS